MKILEDIDELLTYLEDTAHGEEGKRITEMRNRIHTELSNSHKPVIMQGCLYVRDLNTNNIHKVRKAIWSEEDTSIWSDTWYGRHVIGVHCEFVQQPTVADGAAGKTVSDGFEKCDRGCIDMSNSGYCMICGHKV